MKQECQAIRREFPRLSRLVFKYQITAAHVRGLYPSEEQDEGKECGNEGKERENEGKERGNEETRREIEQVLPLVYFYEKENPQGDEGERLQLLKYLKPTLTELGRLPSDWTDEHVDRLKEVLPPQLKSIKLVGCQFSLKSLKTILSRLPCLETVGLEN